MSARFASLTMDETALLVAAQDMVAYLENLADTRNEFGQGSTDRWTLDAVEGGTRDALYYLDKASKPFRSG